MGYQLEEKIIDLFSKVEANIPNVMNDILETGLRNNIIALILFFIGCVICLVLIYNGIKMDPKSDDKFPLLLVSTIIFVVLVGTGATFACNLLEVLYNPDYYIYQHLFQLNS